MDIDYTEVKAAVATLANFFEQISGAIEDVEEGEGEVVAEESTETEDAGVNEETQPEEEETVEEELSIEELRQAVADEESAAEAAEKTEAEATERAQLTERLNELRSKSAAKKSPTLNTKSETDSSDYLSRGTGQSAL